MTRPKSALAKFKEASRTPESDDDKARFNKRLRKLMRLKPALETA